jgi:hypothetical protein
MRKRGAIFIGVAGVVALALAWLFWRPFGETQAYRDCVALMWDRKHPAEVARQKDEAEARRCEAVKLRTGFDGCIDWSGTPEDQQDATTSCSTSLSLEELRRADAEASRATDRPR